MIEQEVPPTDPAQETCWATEDAPVRLAFLIDGRMTMLALCYSFLQARSTIYITAWGLTPDLLLVRGKHHRAGLDGSAEQEELLAWLGTRGLSDEDLYFLPQKRIQPWRKRANKVLKNKVAEPLLLPRRKM